jgi:hypothetical protein
MRINQSEDFNSDRAREQKRICLLLHNLAFSTHILSGLSHIPMRYRITECIGAGILTSYPSTPRFRVSLRSRLTLRR